MKKVVLRHTRDASGSRYLEARIEDGAALIDRKRNSRLEEPAVLKCDGGSPGPRPMTASLGPPHFFIYGNCVIPIGSASDAPLAVPR